MIHLIRNMAFGDVLWLEPVVRYLTERDHRVNVVTYFPTIFDGFPSPLLSVNHLHPLPEEHLLIHMNYEETPSRHILESYRANANAPDMELTYPRLYLSEAEKQPPVSGKYVVLHLEKNPYVNHRNVYGVQWEKVVDAIEQLGMRTIQISKSRTAIYGQWEPLSDWREMMSLIYHAKYFIGIDSGPSHIATAFGIPSLLFFGSVNPAYRHLPTFRGIFLQGFCEYPQCYHKVISPRGQPCRFVGDTGIPPCCVHTTDKVIETFLQLQSMF